ncbi:hypothetical protein BS78_03G049100 [Paspalum vaginatum]|nr:hypothetical protein BS78_03G049100 [Paspalum vaginatum]
MPCQDHSATPSLQERLLNLENPRLPATNSDRPRLISRLAVVAFLCILHGTFRKRRTEVDGKQGSPQAVFHLAKEKLNISRVAFGQPCLVYRMLSFSSSGVSSCQKRVKS